MGCLIYIYIYMAVGRFKYSLLQKVKIKFSVYQRPSSQGKLIWCDGHRRKERREVVGREIWREECGGEKCEIGLWQRPSVPSSAWAAPPTLPPYSRTLLNPCPSLIQLFMPQSPNSQTSYKSEIPFLVTQSYCVWYPRCFWPCPCHGFAWV